MLRFVVLVAALGAVSGVARAQGVPPAPAAPGPPHGVVVLTDGSAVRGRFLENVPHHHVELRANDGTLRRFDASEVRSVVLGTGLSGVHFAGPQLWPERPETSRIRVRSRDDELRVLLLSSDDLVWKTVCVTPCEVELEPGVYRVRLADARGDHSEAGTVRLGMDHANLVAHRESRQAARTLGWLLFGLSAATFVGAVVDYIVEIGKAIDTAFTGGPGYDTRPAVGTGLVAACVALLSLIPALLKDDASLTPAR